MNETFLSGCLFVGVAVVLSVAIFAVLFACLFICGLVGTIYEHVQYWWRSRKNKVEQRADNIPMQVRTQIAAWADTIDEWDQESQGWGVFESMKREMRQLLHG